MIFIHLLPLLKCRLKLVAVPVHSNRILHRLLRRVRQPGVTTNSATATNCVSLYDLRGIH